VFILQNDLYVFGGSFSYGSDDTAPFWVVDVGECFYAEAPAHQIASAG